MIKAIEEATKLWCPFECRDSNWVYAKLVKPEDLYQGVSDE